MAKNVWRVLNAEIDLRQTVQQPNFLTVPPNSNFCNNVVFTAGPAAVPALVAEMEDYMSNPSLTSAIKEYYYLAQHHPPVIGPTHK